GLLLHAMKMHGLGNFVLLLVGLILLNRYVLRDVIHGFQRRVLPRIMSRYEQSLRWALKGSRPGWLIASVFGMFVIAGAALTFSVVSGRTKTDFFPSGDPNFIYVYLKMPVGTKTETTDSITNVLEKKVYKVVGQHNPIVESIISNVAEGATDPL